jgi:hypothetical protein
MAKHGKGRIMNRGFAKNGYSWGALNRFGATISWAGTAGRLPRQGAAGNADWLPDESTYL